MIEVKNLKKKYGTFEALKGINFSVANGTVFCLLGSNGAGKTTIIKIISGLLKQTEGGAYIDGKLAEDDIEVKKIYGYMPEQPHLYERLTGREFLEMMASLRDIDDEIIQKKITEYAKEMELEHVIDSELGSYSKGMKQKILFANAIFHDPQNLILDEPTTGLDPRFTNILKKRIREMAHRDKAVLMSTHITSVAEEIADRVAIINGGKIVAEGTVKELKKENQVNNLEEVFVEVVNNEL